MKKLKKKKYHSILIKELSKRHKKAEKNKGYITYSKLINECDELINPILEEEDNLLSIKQYENQEEHYARQKKEITSKV